jgi:hypothetical protein
MKHIISPELLKKFEEIAQSAVEYFKTDDEMKIDVRFFESLPFTLKDMENHSHIFKKILRKYDLDLESYDEDSVAIFKRELWQTSDKLVAANNKTGVFEKRLPF